MSEDSKNIKKSEYGFVCMLDALGTKASSTNDPQVYIKKMLELKQNTYNQENVTINLDYLFMSDSVVIICHDNEGNISKPDPFRFNVFLLYCLDFFMKGFNNGIFYRGAISIGGIQQKDNFYIGSAINDAVSVYEQTDWIGVVLTQSASYLQLSNILISECTYPSELRKPAIYYRNSENIGIIPFKNNVCSDDLLVLNWPDRFVFEYLALNDFDEYQNAITAKKYLCGKFSEKSISPQANQKYVNTMKFYDYWADKFENDPRIKQHMKSLYDKNILMDKAKIEQQHN